MMRPMHVTVAVDGMGGDHAPSEVVAGAVDAAAEGVRVLVCGLPEQLEKELGDRDRPGIEIVPATAVVGSGDEPAAAVRSKPDSSIVRACRLVRDGAAQAVVSAGPTGAVLAASLLTIGRIRGITRPGIGVQLPARGGTCLLIDAGANADARAESLLQFAIMGSQFMHAVMGVERPRVGLLSIGEEASKGNAVTLEAHALLEAAPDLEFTGNCEGRDVLVGDLEVVVADGFTGNVLLKGLEGTAAVLMADLRATAASSLRARAGGLLLRPALGGLRRGLDPNAVGGAVLLGLRKLVVVPHGSFEAAGITNAIGLAARGVREDVVGRTLETLTAAGALRRAPEDVSAVASSVPEQP
jgi:glycerol-3-phosphate acyltransferase PlsX